MTQTKIVATLGPASESPETVRSLIEAGVGVFRINFSHGEPDAHRRMARTVRSVAGEMGVEVALLGDVAGPRLRCGTISPEPLELETGTEVVLAEEETARRESAVPIAYPYLHEDLRPGQEVALDDGRIRLRVERIEGRRVVCRVVEGGPLRSHKGVNLPETELRVGAVTDRDRASIALAAEEGFDFLGLSFVSSAADVETARSIIGERNPSPALIAKIERRLAVERLDEILDAADGAMVARGDLGVELPIEQVPLVQKRVISECNLRAKPVITATQMLESMIRNRRPTRAEVTDIANAIFDGTDAVMLSGETAIGRYPVETVATMARVARAAESAVRPRDDPENVPVADDDTAMSQAASRLAADLGLDAIVCLTEGGSTARRVARHRPRCPIIAASGNLATSRQLILSWGVEPICLRGIFEAAPAATGSGHTPSVEDWISRTLSLCAGGGKLRAGQRVVVVAGFPLGRPGITNLVHLAVVPEVQK